MILTIYILGFFVAYWIIKKYIREEEDDKWEDVIYTILLSFVWPVTIPIICIFFIKSKPPKWL